MTNPLQIAAQAEDGHGTTAALVHFGWSPSARAAHEMYDKVVQYGEQNDDVTGESCVHGMRSAVMSALLVPTAHFAMRTAIQLKQTHG